MKRRVYYDILMVGFSLVFVYHLFRLIVAQFTDISLPSSYTAGLSYLLLYFIVFYETLQAEKAIKWICIGLFPVVVISKSMIIMHWPFGYLIFIISASLTGMLLLISAYRSGQEKALKILILLYPLNRIVLHRIFISHPEIPWWLVDLFLMGSIAVTLAVKRIKSGRKKTPHA